MNQFDRSSCPVCGHQLPEHQVDIIDQALESSTYTEWFTKGYCSYSCFSTIHGSPEPVDRPPTSKSAFLMPAPSFNSSECPEYLPPVSDSKQAIFEIISGIVLLAIGGLITVGTYWLAHERMTGGHYLLAWGPLVFGVGRICQGLFDYISSKFL